MRSSVGNVFFRKAHETLMAVTHVNALRVQEESRAVLGLRASYLRLRNLAAVVVCFNIPCAISAKLKTPYNLMLQTFSSLVLVPVDFSQQ